jgi:hypothetical protein
MANSISRRKLLALLGLSTTSGCLRFAGDDTANGTSGGGAGSGTRGGTRTLRPTATPTSTPREETATPGANTPTATPTQTPAATAEAAEGETATATETGTPGETATATEAEGRETVTDVTYPPGMTENTVTESLLDTHGRQVRGTANFTAVMREEQEFFETSRTAKVESKERMRMQMAFPDGTGTILRVSDGIYQRGEGTELGNVVYSYVPLDKYPFPIERAVMANRMRSVVVGGAYEPGKAFKRDGETIIQIGAEEVESAEALLELAYQAESVSSFSGGGEVTEGGVIKTLAGTAEFEGGDTSSVRRLLRTSDVGSTTVETPGWKSDVKDKQPTFDVTTTEDNKFLRVEKTGGQEVPPEIRIDANWWDENRFMYGRLEQGIEEGEPVYLYKDGTERLAHSYGEKPSADPDPFSGEFTFNIWTFVVKLLAQDFNI